MHRRECVITRDKARVANRCDSKVQRIADLELVRAHGVHNHQDVTVCVRKDGTISSFLVKLVFLVVVVVIVVVVVVVILVCFAVSAASRTAVNVTA